MYDYDLDRDDTDDFEGDDDTYFLRLSWTSEGRHTETPLVTLSPQQLEILGLLPGGDMLIGLLFESHTVESALEWTADLVRRLGIEIPPGLKEPINDLAYRHRALPPR